MISDIELPRYHPEGVLQAPPGKEHYKLLAYMSTLFDNKTIIELGTHEGMSSFCLGYNSSNTIHTFDITDKPKLCPPQDNIVYHIENIWDPETREQNKKLILESHLIFLDIAPHNGSMEIEFYNWLVENKYQGLLVLDDIWFYKEMRDNCWYKIPVDNRLDITEFGHWAGTGLVFFEDSLWPRDFLKTPPDINNDWTFVTGMFDLSTQNDTSDDSRPIDFYFDNCQFTLNLSQPLIVFCDPKFESRIWDIRPAYLHSKTKVITKKFSDFPLHGYKRIIKNNRKLYPSHDPRNTPSYYLLCMARYFMMSTIAKTNPFDSTHFCWMNFCIERMGYNNIRLIDGVISLKRDKFSNSYVQYVPKKYKNNPIAYYTENMTSCLASGFFTGDRTHMLNVCKAIVDQFHKCLKLGLGHADEQLFAFVLNDHPEWFRPYCGDYNQVITNYCSVLENPRAGLYNVIHPSMADGDYETAYQQSLDLVESHCSKLLDVQEKAHLCAILITCVIKCDKDAGPAIKFLRDNNLKISVVP